MDTTGPTARRRSDSPRRGRMPMRPESPDQGRPARFDRLRDALLATPVPIGTAIAVRPGLVGTA